MRSLRWTRNDLVRAPLQIRHKLTCRAPRIRCCPGDGSWLRRARHQIRRASGRSPPARFRWASHGRYTNDPFAPIVHANESPSNSGLESRRLFKGTRFRSKQRQQPKRRHSMRASCTRDHVVMGDAALRKPFRICQSLREAAFLILLCRDC
jgi:hypothetical protein